MSFTDTQAGTQIYVADMGYQTQWSCGTNQLAVWPDGKTWLILGIVTDSISLLAVSNSHVILFLFCTRWYICSQWIWSTMVNLTVLKWGTKPSVISWDWWKCMESACYQMPILRRYLLYSCLASKFRLLGLHCYLHLNGSACVTNTLAYPLSRCIEQPNV